MTYWVMLGGKKGHILGEKKIDSAQQIMQN